MKCMYCQAEMKKSTAPFHIDRKGVHVSIDEVPAWVCPQCGESYFEEQEVDFMQALVKAVEEQTKSLPRRHKAPNKALNSDCLSRYRFFGSRLAQR